MDKWPGYPDPGKRCPICYPTHWLEEPPEVALMPRACERVAEHPRPDDVARWQRRR